MIIWHCRQAYFRPNFPFSYNLDSMAFFCIVDFFIALKMFIKLENDPPFPSLSGLESRLDCPDDESSSMLICCFMYFLAKENTLITHTTKKVI